MNRLTDLETPHTTIQNPLEKREPHKPIGHPSSSPLVNWLENTAWLPWGILGLALVLRLFLLGITPPQAEEGITGMLARPIQYEGFFVFNHPTKGQGPLPHFIFFFTEALFGIAWMELFRLPAVILGTATVWLILQFRRFISKPLCLLAALAAAVSPGMVFFSRAAIVEPYLLVGMLLVFWGLAEIFSYGAEKGFWAFTIGIASLFLVIPAFTVHLLLLALAVFFLWIAEQFSPSEPTPSITREVWPKRRLFNILVVPLLLIIGFYSTGLMNIPSLVAFKNSLTEWLYPAPQTLAPAAPTPYWLQLIITYELPAFIGLAASFRLLQPGMNRLVRLMGIYGVIVLVFYTVTKSTPPLDQTPWCVISLLWPFLFLFGDTLTRPPAFRAFEKLTAISNILNGLKLQRVLPVLAALALLISTTLAIRLNYFKPSDFGEPYASQRTPKDTHKLIDNLDKLSKINPVYYITPIHIYLEKNHPFPWLLGKCTALGVFERPEHRPENYDAGIILVPRERVAEVEAQIKDAYFAEPFIIRDDLPPAKLYLSTKVFSPLYPDRKEDIPAK
jgi:hypothetical protein